MQTIKMPFIKFNQPIGSLYLGTLSIENILKFANSISRYDNRQEGIQRKLDPKRIDDIASYSNSFDATFPTPIILAGKSTYVSLLTNDELNITIPNSNEEKFLIVDGQHRVYGIQKGGAVNIEVPVILILDTTIEQNIQIFSVINSNQKTVTKSLIYDLFGQTTHRSLEKACHIIAQELNSDPKSPFFTKLKMLGTKESADPVLNKDELKFNDTNDIRYIDLKDTEIVSNANNVLPTLSQGVFIDILITYITNDRYRDNLDLQNNQYLTLLKHPKYIFREHFVNKEDNLIYLILRNYFNAVKDIFIDEWDSPKSVISKSTGYIALMQLLAYDIYPKAMALDNFSKSTFKILIKELLDNIPLKKRKEINSSNFGSSKGGANNLYRYFIGLDNDLN